MIFIVDFDGTITRRDTVDALLEAFADPAWRAIETEWLAGHIDSRRCMAEQLALVKVRWPQLMRFLASVEIEPSFAGFYHEARKVGIPVIVSDGLDMAIDYLMRSGALPQMPFFANRAKLASQGLHLSFPHAAADCTIGSGVCKCAVARSYTRCFGGATVLIGDGMSDKCIASRADYVFAKGALARFCDERKIHHAPFNSFDEILPRLSADIAAGAALRATS